MTYMFWALFDGFSSWAKENKPNTTEERELTDERPRGARMRVRELCFANESERVLFRVFYGKLGRKTIRCKIVYFFISFPLIKRRFSVDHIF